MRLAVLALALSLLANTATVLAWLRARRRWRRESSIAEALSERVQWLEKHRGVA